MLPDVDYQKNDEAGIAEIIGTAEAKMDEAAKQDLIVKNKKLKELQESPDKPEDIATIPLLKLSDVPDKVEIIPMETSSFPFLLQSLASNQHTNTP